MLVAVLMVLASAALWPLMDAVGKHLVVSGYPAVQVAWARYAVNVLFLLPVALARGGRGSLLPRGSPMHLLRATLPSAVTALLFVGLGQMPLASASALLFVNPLLTVALSALLLGERVGARRWAAVAVGFAGALVVLRPGTEVFTWAALAPLGAALCFSITAILNRRLAGEAAPLATTLHYAIAGSAVLLPWSAAGNWRALEPAAVGWLALGAVVGSGCLWLVTTAYERAQASALAPFHFAELAAATAVGWGVFGELPDAIAIAGIVLILSAGLLATWGEPARTVNQGEGGG
jgi:drug/metabolite transporter (DMT)-like permease